MADFQTSTHRDKWIFSPQELVEKYKSANQRAIQTLGKYGTTQMEVDADGSLSYPEHIPTSILLQNLLILKKNDTCGCFMKTNFEKFVVHSTFLIKFRYLFLFIIATALIYFKRFYLQWSVMEHHPKHIMLTCVYAACKIEENHVSAVELGNGISQDHQMILNYEMIVYQSLEFDLIVYAPYQSGEGFVNDMEEFCGAKDEENQMLKVIFVSIFCNIVSEPPGSPIPTYVFCRDVSFSVCRAMELIYLYLSIYLMCLYCTGFARNCRMEVDKIMLTDAPYLFPPGQLALAALRSANEMHRVLDFERFLLIIGFVTAIRSRRKKGTNPTRVQMKFRMDQPLLNLMLPLAHWNYLV
ncbi:hypothetical protein PTKIN_Ptkin01aG0317300 [Pterospermum kingtungense]